MKLSHILIALTCVYSTFASSSFIGEGKRAELFEITDNEVPVIKITIPKEDYQLMRMKASIGGVNENITFKFQDFIYETQYMMELALDVVQIMNFNVLFPGEDFSKTFPELNINKNGYPEIDSGKILNGFDWDPSHYVDNDFGVGKYFYAIDKTNSNFDFEKIISRIIDIKTENVEGIDPDTEAAVGAYKHVFDVPDLHDFKTKNATMSVDINGEHKQFNEVTFSLGGISSRFLQKPGFNIKIRGGDSLYGLTQIRLRSDRNDPTILRTKLVTDIRNKLGLSSISANYANVYVNDDFLGFFVLRDAIKSSWIEFEFGEKDTKSLYKCSNYSYLTKDYSSVNCNNEDESVEDNTELIEFLTALDKAQSAADIDDIFEVDQFLTDMALDYLFGAWDHFIYTGENYSVYKQTNGKWKYIPNDHDFDFGINMDRVGFSYIFTDMPERTEKLLNIDYPNLSYPDWIRSHHLTDILIFKDPSRFEKILKDLVVKVFNPSTLYPHIDELKKFVKPYIEKELVNNKDVVIYNPEGLKSFTYEEWDANSEFTSVKTQMFYAYGLKYWILAKYRYMCKAYQDIECDSTYLDENYDYPINKKVEFTGYTKSDSSLPESNTENDDNVQKPGKNRDPKTNDNDQKPNNNRNPKTNDNDQKPKNNRNPKTNDNDQKPKNNRYIKNKY